MKLFSRVIAYRLAVPQLERRCCQVGAALLALAQPPSSLSLLWLCSSPCRNAMVSRNEPRPRKRVIPLKMLLASLEPKAKTWHADPASRPLPPVQRDLRQQALAHRQQPPKPPQLDPYIPPDVEAPQPQLTASSNDPPLLIFDRPEEGAQQLAALCPSSPHPLPLGNWVFSSCTHLYEAVSRQFSL